MKDYLSPKTVLEFCVLKANKNELLAKLNVTIVKLKPFQAEPRAVRVYVDPSGSTELCKKFLLSWERLGNYLCLCKEFVLLVLHHGAGKGSLGLPAKGVNTALCWRDT